ncbi:hypothetical protein RI103_24730 [Paraburkholderia sp. FT54]|uniref:hypothetical protein n=1 Tax=Paraburkholderia sp. FT54 TaxID=3074437 RepID=UPI002877FFDE|nr:hypothetical protein [Paraburkholderia sp. FT54]WNC93987.1 hypothetical protein RI103_24730 [Paraburkholderia sp. FT54]
MKLPRIFAIPTLLLAGCTFYGPQSATPVKMYEGPEKAANQVASVLTFDFLKKRENQLETAWKSNVVEVDGRPVPGGKYDNQKVLLEPGVHFLTVTCSSGYRPNTHTRKFRLELKANQLYVPSAQLEYGTRECTPDVVLMHMRS